MHVKSSRHFLFIIIIPLSAYAVKDLVQYANDWIGLPEALQAKRLGQPEMIAVESNTFTSGNSWRKVKPRGTRDFPRRAIRPKRRKIIDPGRIDS